LAFIEFPEVAGNRSGLFTQMDTGGQARAHPCNFPWNRHFTAALENTLTTGEKHGSILQGG